jgi:hypothetical protein
MRNVCTIYMLVKKNSDLKSFNIKQRSDNLLFFFLMERFESLFI